MKKLVNGIFWGFFPLVHVILEAWTKSLFDQYMEGMWNDGICIQILILTLSAMQINKKRIKNGNAAILINGFTCILNVHLDIMYINCNHVMVVLIRNEITGCLLSLKSGQNWLAASFLTLKPIIYIYIYIQHITRSVSISLLGSMKKAILCIKQSFLNVIRAFKTIRNAFWCSNQTYHDLSFLQNPILCKSNKFWLRCGIFTEAQVKNL